MPCRTPSSRLTKRWTRCPAFRAAMAPRPRSIVYCVPEGVQRAAAEASAPPSLLLSPLGAAPADMIRKAAEKIFDGEESRHPVGDGREQLRRDGRGSRNFKATPRAGSRHVSRRGRHFARTASIVLRTRGALSQPARRQSACQSRCRADRWLRSRGIRSELLPSSAEFRKTNFDDEALSERIQRSEG